MKTLNHNESVTLMEIVKALYNWYDTDGSVGGADFVFEENRVNAEFLMSVFKYDEDFKS